MSSDALATAERRYHHGDLRKALLVEAERIVEQDGIPALTLRAVARAVGVTHAAPSNHFGDLTGLLSELAAEGFRRFTASLEAGLDAAGPDPRSRATALGQAYVAFARAHRGLFTLMFRSERLDATRAALKDAIVDARKALQRVVAERAAGETIPAATRMAQGVALWSLVHGYAVLLLDGRLNGALAALPAGHTETAFFDAVLGAVMLR
jgi:AcrR family transcriptional regulator